MCLAQEGSHSFISFVTIRPRLPFSHKPFSGEEIQVEKMRELRDFSSSLQAPRALHLHKQSASFK
jgi:hypothetical protein